MEHLDFGWGFGVIVLFIGLFKSLQIGVFIFIVSYLPSIYLLRNRFKPTTASQKLIKQFIIWIVFSALAGAFVTYIEIHFRLFNLHHISNLPLSVIPFIPFLFYKYEVKNNYSRISISGVQSIKSIIFNYLILWIILYVFGTFTLFGFNVYGGGQFINLVVGIIIFAIFLRVRNIRIMS